METVTKATVNLGDKTITFEGPAEFVRQEVAKYVRVEAEDGGVATPTGGVLPSDGTDTLLSEEEAVKQKRPLGHSELVAVLAFCLAQRGVEEFTDQEIRKAYLRAKVKPPKVVAQAIRDAKNHFEFVESGSKRGTYRLSDHGDRVVRFDLPRSA